MITPTPTVKGKAAKKFWNEINKTGISEEQLNFLNECKKQLKKEKKA